MRGVAVAIAENLSDGVRVLLATHVPIIVVDAETLKHPPREAATLLARVAPGVPPVAAVGSHAPLGQRLAFELAGFRVLTRPVSVERLLDEVRALEAR